VCAQPVPQLPQLAPTNAGRAFTDVPASRPQVNQHHAHKSGLRSQMLRTPSQMLPDAAHAIAPFTQHHCNTEVAQIPVSSLPHRPASKANSPPGTFFPPPSSSHPWPVVTLPGAIPPQASAKPTVPPLAHFTPVLPRTTHASLKAGLRWESPRSDLHQGGFSTHHSAHSACALPLLVQHCVRQPCRLRGNQQHEHTPCACFRASDGIQGCVGTCPVYLSSLRQWGAGLCEHAGVVARCTLVCDHVCLQNRKERVKTMSSSSQECDWSWLWSRVRGPTALHACMRVCVCVPAGP